MVAEGIVAEGAEAWPWTWPSPRQRTPKTRRRRNRDELKPRNLRMDRSPLADESESESDESESEKESDEEEDKEDEESDGSEEGFVLSQEAAARFLTEPRRSGRKTPAQLHVSIRTQYLSFYFLRARKLTQSFLFVYCSSTHLKV